MRESSSDSERSGGLGNTLRLAQASWRASPHSPQLVHPASRFT